MSILDTPVNRLDGSTTTLGELTGGRPALLVNVASRCGLTPQYTELEELQRSFGPRGFTVVGFPCNQFAGQEPGTAEEIAEFCSATYGVTFPLTEKVDVNGDERHPVYTTLTEVADADGHQGDIRWNFEKFLVDGTGAVVARFNPEVTPTDPALVAQLTALVDSAQ